MYIRSTGIWEFCGNDYVTVRGSALNGRYFDFMLTTLTSEEAAWQESATASRMRWVGDSGNTRHLTEIMEEETLGDAITSVVADLLWLCRRNCKLKVDAVTKRNVETALTPSGSFGSGCGFQEVVTSACRAVRGLAMRRGL